MLSEYSVLETCEMSLDAPIPPFTGSMDVDEFMAFLETRPGKEHWELIEGVAVLMTPASYAHQRITRNFCELLNSAFSEQHLDLFAYFSAGVRNPGLRNFQPEPDVVVVDPPRAGLSQKVVRRVLEAEAQRIVYVSCNPTTLAPNAAQLVEAGYRLVKVRPVDMFPQTPHIECVALLERG